MISQLVVFPLFDALTCLSKIGISYAIVRTTITGRAFTSKKRKQNRWREHFETGHILQSFEHYGWSSFRNAFREHVVMDETFQWPRSMQ